jgi:hypothetical protein
MKARITSAQGYDVTSFASFESVTRVALNGTVVRFSSATDDVEMRFERDEAVKLAVKLLKLAAEPAFDALAKWAFTKTGNGDTKTRAARVRVNSAIANS